MQYRYPGVKILIFTKPPYAGKCKTRLIPHLGEKGAAQLQEKLLFKIISELSDSKICPFEIWQSEESNYFLQLESINKLTIKTQAEGDLGYRMSAAISESLANSDYVIVIGSDCAEYTEEYLTVAITSLSNNDVVIGPAYDGGYVLIGMSKFYPQIFKDIEWGSAKVFEQTRHCLEQGKISYASLPKLHDIDRPEDLEHLMKIESNFL